MSTPTKKPTNTQLAAALGVTALTVGKWRKLGAPCDSADLLRVWREGRERLHRAPANDDGIRTARLLKLEREAALLGLKLESARGELVERVQVRADFAFIAQAMRQRLNFLRTEAPCWEGLSAAQILARVETFIAETERELHDKSSQTYRDAAEALKAGAAVVM